MAVILGMKEREVDQYLPDKIREKLRKVVLDQMNDYHELCLDVIRSLDTGEVTLNDVYLKMIEDIHKNVEEQRTLYGEGDGR